MRPLCQNNSFFIFWIALDCTTKVTSVGTNHLLAPYFHRSFAHTKKFAFSSFIGKVYLNKKCSPRLIKKYRQCLCRKPVTGAQFLPNFISLSIFSQYQTNFTISTKFHNFQIDVKDKLCLCGQPADPG